MLEVWRHHRKVDEFSPDHTRRVDGGALEILDTTGAVVKRYEAGDWASAGLGAIVCAYIEDDPTCPRCHPPHP